MRGGEARDAVGADLVRDVARARDAIGADDHEVDPAAAHELRDHRVGDERRPSKPSRASSHAVSRAPWRTGRVSHATTRTRLPCSRRRAHDAERRAVPARRERARVAVREHGRAVGDALGADAAHRAARRHVLAVDGARLGRERRRVAGRSRHPVERPCEVHRGGARAPQPRDPLVDVAPAGRREDDAVGRRDPDGRRAAHRERLDRHGDVLDAAQAHVLLLERQPALVEQDDLAVARGELDRGVRGAAQRLRVRQPPRAHDGGSPFESAMRAAISSVAVPSSSSAFSLSPWRYARRP